MSDPTSSPVDGKSTAEPATDVEAELTDFVNRNLPKSSVQPSPDAERIRSAVARLTANSIDGLEALASELQELQKFLHSEVQRVQNEIESALAGIKIIVETLEPLKNRPGYIPVSTGTQVSRGFGRQLFRSFG
jgi:hypothetical protein